MRYSELSQKNYPVNRKLTAEEKRNQLHQNNRLNIAPFYNISTITMNSTFLETVDRLFIYRGVVTAGFIFFSIFLLIMAFMPIYAFPGNKISVRVMLMAITFVLFSPLWMFFYWVMRKESYRWTHFPIRFNYRNRMVYVFCLDGVIRSAKWDDLFFTLSRAERMAVGQRWDIRGHALKADRETVEWTFALRGDSFETEQLKHVWEFVRRYMEEGPESVCEDVLWCHDVRMRRETFREGLNVLYFQFNGLPIAQLISAPIFWLYAVGRWFVMKTSKIPEWPAEIEAQCEVDELDPYERTAAQNPPKIPTESVRAAWSRIGS